MRTIEEKMGAKLLDLIIEATEIKTQYDCGEIDYIDLRDRLDVLDYMVMQASTLAARENTRIWAERRRAKP